MKKKEEKKQKPLNDPDHLISDDFRDEMRGSPGRPPVVGKTICGAPFEMEKILDYTCLRGGGSNIYYSLIYQIPKWGFALRKVDEWIEVTPTWAEYYNITIGQKQKLEGSIKQGLTSAAQSVADYELLTHDLRRYKEILDYFKKSHLQKDDHVLRSLFVDRVDAHTGEGYSMITMAKRWPTIITDFIRMKSEWMDRSLIRKELDVSDAEATVLLTKNQLYAEWKELFLPTIKDRVARLEVLAESRKKSIDEYRNWLKPYVARYRMIREKMEISPTEHLSDAFMTPGFGQSQAITGVRLWFWRPFFPPEKGKPEAVSEKGSRRGFVIDPYDDLVREWQVKIEKRYQVSFSEKDINKLIEEWAKVPKFSYKNPLMDPKAIYYMFIDARVLLSLLRTPPPEGVETDNLMFMPIRNWFMAQNALLIHLLELKARDMAFEKYIEELIGTREAEEAALERIEKEFAPEEEKKMRLRAFGQRMSAVKGRVKPPADTLFHLFVKRGPYEPVFRERLSKMYARGTGPMYGTILSFLQKKMQIE